MKYNGMNVHVFKHTEQQPRFSELADTVRIKEGKKRYKIMSLPQKEDRRYTCKTKSKEKCNILRSY